MSYPSEPTDLLPHPVPEWADRCPSCTFGTANDERTYGCGECNWTGRARRWKLEGRKLGGHWHVTVRCGRPGAGAKLGDLVMDEHDWADICSQLEAIPFWTIEDLSV